MTSMYTKESLSKMRSGDLRETILRLQSQHELAMKHLNQSVKEQVEVQKYMIQELLSSEEKLKSQLQEVTEKYNALKAQKSFKAEVSENKNSNVRNNISNPVSFNQGESQKLKLFINEKELTNSCILEEEESKTEYNEQFSLNQNSNHSNMNKDITPTKMGIELKSGQNLTFSAQQNLFISKGPNSNTNRNENDYIYKSIQSNNYIIMPPENGTDYNLILSQIEHPEPILMKNHSSKNRLEVPTSSRNANDIHKITTSQFIHRKNNSKSNLSIVLADKESESYTNFNFANSHPQQSIFESQNLQGGAFLKKSKNTPVIERKHSSNKESIFVSQAMDNNFNHQQNHYTPDVIKSQQLFVSSVQAQGNGFDASTINPTGENLKVGDLFFEDFFIIGPSIQELKSVAQNSPNLMQGTVSPDIYVSFPGQVDTNDQDQRHSLKNFCFPFDVSFQKYIVNDIHQGKVDDILNLQIFKTKLSPMSPNSFAFSMLGETERANDRSILNPILLNSNPHISLYCICFTTENFITIPLEGESKKQSNSVYLTPLTYCFMTYYPFISHFLDIISEIASQIKITRAQQYINLFSSQSEPPTKCSFCLLNDNKSSNIKTTESKNQKYQLSPIQERQSEQSHRDSTQSRISEYNTSDSSRQQSANCCTCNNSLTKILELDIENEVKTFLSQRFLNIREALVKSQKEIIDYQKEVKFKFRMENEGFIKNYMIPACNRIGQIETEWGARLAMSCLPLEDFLFIMTAVALESRMIFFSSNLSLLTSVILTFYSLFKPFLYVLPVIYNLPVRLIDMLEAPVPLMLGINKDISFKSTLEQQYGTDFSDKIVIDLDSKKIIIEQPQLRNYIEKNVPLLKSQQQDLTEYYFAVNNKNSREFKTFNSLRKKRLSVLSASDAAQINQEGDLLYEMTEEQYNAMSSFIESIRAWVDKCFIKNLPPKDQIQQFNLQKIQQIVISKNKDDLEFIKEFVKTQTFTTYVETIYLYPDTESPNPQ